MQNLPIAEVYEQEVTYMPWGKLVREILRHATFTPQGGTVLDLLCGTGHLLGALGSVRPDLSLTGVDLEPEFIEYARRTHPGISFEIADARTWQNEKVDLVLVTGGLHHLPYEDQPAFVEHLAGLVKETGRVLIGDPYIETYEDEEERKLAAARLGYEYLKATIENGAPDSVIRAAVQLIENDVFLVEFKTSILQMEMTFRDHFELVRRYKTWPRGKVGFGDYFFVLEEPYVR